MLLATVAVPVPLGQALTYQVPALHASRYRRGMRVLCPLGHRTVIGVILTIDDTEPTVPVTKLKPLGPAVDIEPALPDELLDFLLELARYYWAPVGEVLRLALPAVERSQDNDAGLFAAKAKVVGKLVQCVHRVDPSPREAATLKGKAAQVLAAVPTQPTLVRDVERDIKGARAVLKRLAEQGFVRIETTTRVGDRFFDTTVARDTPPALTAAQQAAVAGIGAAIDAGKRQAFLLHGVTASGKTEVYLHVVQRCLLANRGALVLVPEIALTPQLVGRFRARLGDSIAVIHSALTDSDRHATWKRLRSGEVRVAIGARSALFAPVANLGLICVDEEHDASFKQEEGVRYHARDMALWRAHRAGGQCVLGSATPSLTSLALADRQVLEKFVLPARARAAAALPTVEIVDLTRNKAGPTGERLLTWPLTRALERVLEAKEQAILFLNRRGFAPSLVCDQCGTIVRCPDCSIALTVHRRGQARVECHLCDYHAPLPGRCSACNATEFSEEGAGTERIETALLQYFSQARIARLDRDVAGGAKSEAVLDRVRRREVDILVGTQMVTKGHDLPDVTLVGVLDADAALSMPDYRAAERAFQLLVQVAGRAGRGARPGRVVVQTRQPDSPVITCALRHDVNAFVAHEMSQREQLMYPPFARLALVRFEGLDDALVCREADRVAQLVRRAAIANVKLSGPAPAPIVKVRNRWRHRFLLKSVDRQKLRDALAVVNRTAVDHRVRVIIDVDPMNML